MKSKPRVEVNTDTSRYAFNAVCNYLIYSRDRTVSCDVHLIRLVNLPQTWSSVAAARITWRSRGMYWIIEYSFAYVNTLVIESILEHLSINLIFYFVYKNILWVTALLWQFETTRERAEQINMHTNSCPQLDSVDARQSQFIHSSNYIIIVGPFVASKWKTITVSICWPNMQPSVPESCSYRNFKFLNADTTTSRGCLLFTLVRPSL